MPAITPSVFAKGLSAKKFEIKPIYFLYGSEPKRLIELAKRLKDRLLAQSGEDNYFRYVRLGDGPEEKNSGDVIAILNTVSMFGGGNVVMVGPLENVKAEDAQAFCAYATSPNSQATLILTVTTPKKDNKALSQLERSKLGKTFIANSVAVKFTEQKAGDLSKWISNRFESNGLTADRAAIVRLLELCDHDLDRIANEVEKLVAFVGDATTVTLDDVEQTVGDHRQNTIWSLIDAVRSKNLKSATISLESLMDQNLPSQMILKLLTTELARLFAASSMRKNGASLMQYKKEMGGAPWPLEKAWSYAARWTEDDARTGLDAILTTSVDMMKARVAPATAMTKLIGDLCQPAGAAR